MVSFYLYTMDHQVISTYRRAVTPKHNYASDIYSDPECTNAEIVKKYVELDNPVMLVSSYYNEYRNKNILRFVMKLYNESNLQDKIGYVVCDVDTKNLEKIMDKYRIDRTAFMWLQQPGIGRLIHWEIWMQNRQKNIMLWKNRLPVGKKLKMKPIQNRNFSVLISNIII